MCSSMVLATGAVLVDLPKNADANVARASIAQNYLAKCQHILIVSNCTKVVDNQNFFDIN